jgi:hypothetical protein
MTCPESAKGAIQGGVDAWRESGRGWIDGCRAAWPVPRSLAAPGAGSVLLCSHRGRRHAALAEADGRSLLVGSFGDAGCPLWGPCGRAGNPARRWHKNFNILRYQLLYAPLNKSGINDKNHFDVIRTNCQNPKDLYRKNKEQLECPKRSCGRSTDGIL